MLSGFKPQVTFMKHKKQHDSTVKFAVLFIVIVAALILISVIVKAVITVKNSSFDGEHRFNLGIIQKNEASVVSFSPANGSITILNLKGNLQSKSLSQFLELPIDATLKTKNLVINKNNIASDMSNVLFNYPEEDTSMTIVDAFRLYLFARSVSSDSVYESDLQANDSLSISSFVSSSFIDSDMANQKTTIEVVNATSAFGLAGRLADFINNMGGDVVMVTTSDTPQDNSEIMYSGDENYTIKRLSQILGFKPVRSSNLDISDVKIIIGKDSLQNLKF